MSGYWLSRTVDVVGKKEKGGKKKSDKAIVILLKLYMSLVVIVSGEKNLPHGKSESIRILVECVYDIMKTI